MNTKKEALSKIIEAFPPNAERDALISHIDVDDPLRAFYEVVMDNQLAYNKKQRDNKPLQDVFSKIALYELKGLRIMHDMVGFQPMTGPVSDLYTLRTTRQEDNRMTLEILKEEIEAGSRKTSAGLEITTESMLDMKDGINKLHEDEEQIKRAGYQIADEHVVELYNIMTKFASMHKEYRTVELKSDPEDLMSSQLACIVNQHANKIADRTRRGSGNYVIIGEEVLEALQGCSAFEAVSFDMSGKAILKYAGELNGTIKVYLYKYASNKVICGYKGPTEVDAGLYFSPYVPVMSAGPVINPITFQPVLSFMTRYNVFADKVSNDYFSGFEVEFI